MKDEFDKRLDALFASARSHQPDTSGREAYFEARLLARLAERKELTASWDIVWRMVPVFATVAAIVLTCTILFNPARSTNPLTLASYGQDDAMAQSYLGGK